MTIGLTGKACRHISVVIAAVLFSANASANDENAKDTERRYISCNQFVGTPSNTIKNIPLAQRHDQMTAAQGRTDIEAWQLAKLETISVLSDARFSSKLSLLSKSKPVWRLLFRGKGEGNEEVGNETDSKRTTHPWFRHDRGSSRPDHRWQHGGCLDTPAELVHHTASNFRWHG